ncbi:hypothetical protein FHS59_000102 [Algoriphagus iocasae]|uniref:Uncharacterized protein n=1 Tax=Algoriphagus iocasae TaxID=1836499 RepID=A0A841MG59_9BACT|nr:hypothetical protein [Algoriphagus iocasae]MBB6324487.1 hypothetical protein [Algoriphagus iocasae]
MTWTTKTLIALILMPLLTPVHAQTPQEWTNQKELQTAYKMHQIVALQAYLRVAEKGYAIVQTGWKLAGDIRNGAFGQHRDYFSSLEMVHPLVKKDPNVKAIADTYSRITRVASWINSLPGQSKQLDQREQTAVQQFVRTIIIKSEHVLGECHAVLSPGTYQMEDAQRMAALEVYLREMEALYQAIKACYLRLRLVDQNRERKTREQHVINTLYGIR